MYNKIVRTPMLRSDPVVIKVAPEPDPIERPDDDAASDDAEQSEVKTAEPAIDEEAVNTILAEIAAKEQRAIQKLKDAETEANILKQKAENERQELLDKAKVEIEKLKADVEKSRADAVKQGRDEGIKEGKKKGYDDGVKTAKKEFAGKIKEANQKAQKTLQDAKELTAEYFIRAEEDIAKIVMLAIEKILPQHFLDVPQVVLPVVRQAIKQVRDQKEIKIHVAPDNYDIVLMAKAEFQAMLTDGTAVLEVISDDVLSVGDCVVETPNGGVDARLLTQIELMKDAIRSVLPSQ